MLDTLTTLSLPYLLALFALTVQWLLSVWRQAQAGRRPRLAYLAAPGLAALLAAPLVQADPLFGLGAALLLIAAYAGGAYTPAPASHHRRALRWGRVLVLGLAFLGGVGQGLSLPAWVRALWAGLLLLALGYMLSSGRQRQAPAPIGVPGLALRFGPLNSPAWPDLELRVEGDHARLQNVGSSRLLLAGWSPSGENGWLRPQDAQGQVLSLLPKGGTALLSPWPAGQSGVRVWYVRQGEPEVALVFRADWTPLNSAQRVLN
ncbi:hypothetical protein [Deinococcus sp.]|uniref:hypothetical protein n=1 Tax=Deinococcus sp. TaxID=47478 RepID=UPI003C7D897D